MWNDWTTFANCYYVFRKNEKKDGTKIVQQIVNKHQLEQTSWSNN